MILVSILGDFHSSFLPMFFEFKDKIEKHIIVHDDSKYDVTQLKKVIKGQIDFLNGYGKFTLINYEIVPLSIDEDSYDAIFKCYEMIIKYSENPKDIYLNTTDGLNSISIILSSKFLKYGSNVIAYDRHANTYNLHTKSSMIKYTINHNMDIKNHLKLKGYDLIGYADKHVLNERKEAIYMLMEDSKNYKEFVNQIGEKSIHNFDGYENYINILRSIGELNNMFFIQGTVFEEYIYHIIRDNFNFDEVMLGVQIEFEKDFRNELDILMIKDNHLHTIECKFVNFISGEHYVYKTNSIIDYLDDDGKAMIISIGGENERYLKSGKKRFQFTKGDKGRAANGNIKIYQNKVFDIDDFIDSVSSWFDVKITTRIKEIEDVF